MPEFPNKPTPLEFKNSKFLIMDAPLDSNAPAYIKALKAKHVSIVVRACDPTYSTADFEKEGITINDLAFPDGHPPPPTIITQWLDIVDSNKGSVIAVHCVAGLGRAPVLVGIALVEAGMPPYSAVEFIRKKRRGALNKPQCDFLTKYKPRSKPKSCCVVM